MTVNFSKLPFGHWKDTLHHKQLFDKLGETLGYKCLDDWYNVTVEDIITNGGRTLLQDYYNGSPSFALQNIYSQHIWMLWRFKTVPKGYRKRLETDSAEALRMFEWLGERLAIRNLDDWHRVSLTQLITNWGIFKSGNDLWELLTISYPQHHWKRSREFGKQGAHPKSAQRELLHAIQQLFPTQSKFIACMG